MSDTTLNAFVASGTAAERVAFVPDPPTPVVGPDPGYFFFETDTGSTYAWDGAVWVIVANGSTGDVTGPASAVDDRIATFDGITGKLLQDGGSTIADVIADAVAGAVSSIVPVDILTDTDGFPGGTSTFLRADQTFAAPPSGGDVVGPAASVDKEIALFDATTGKLLERATGTGIVRVTSGVYGTPGAVDLTTEVTGDLPYANIVQASAASRLLVRGSAGGAGDWQEGTLGTGLSLTGTVLSASAAAAGIRVVGVTVDGGGAVVTTGAKGFVQCPITGTITKWTILANGTGNLTFGVKKDAFGSFPPTTSIVASAPPSMTGAASATQSSLGTWSLSVTAGDVFGFEITGTPTVITLATLQIEVTP